MDRVYCGGSLPPSHPARNGPRTHWATFHPGSPSVSGGHGGHSALFLHGITVV